MLKKFLATLVLIIFGLPYFALMFLVGILGWALEELFNE